MPRANSQPHATHLRSSAASNPYTANVTARASSAWPHSATVGHATVATTTHRATRRPFGTAKRSASASPAKTTLAAKTISTGRSTNADEG